MFLLYGYYRAIRMPGMSVVLTILSLGTRVVLSYWLASIPSIGVTGIWWSIPIGWFLADLAGIAITVIANMQSHGLDKNPPPIYIYYRIFLSLQP